jgi:hypothetical protein
MRQLTTPARASAALRQNKASEMRTIGIMLFVVGILGLVYGGVNCSRNRANLDGDLIAPATAHKSVPAPADIGAVMLIGTVALLVVVRRRP